MTSDQKPKSDIRHRPDQASDSATTVAQDHIPPERNNPQLPLSTDPIPLFEPSPHGQLTSLEDANKQSLSGAENRQCTLCTPASLAQLFKESTSRHKDGLPWHNHMVVESALYRTISSHSCDHGKERGQQTNYGYPPTSFGDYPSCSLASAVIVPYQASKITQPNLLATMGKIRRSEVLSPGRNAELHEILNSISQSTRPLLVENGATHDNSSNDLLYSEVPRCQVTASSRDDRKRGSC
ncbi:hypothetical protein EJ08DRAFT_663085 [Tothia fuscella]|uniref:Uncharacterized protein n=1 Tax=Tothia fuscella TaxID=1048955 RepID=A0A9P4NLR8_9PEZI|nr:hypothetical protein EJ08DRAFT_663085 [Tothia fuscella]